MLWTLLAVVLVLWVLGFSVGGSLILLLLVAALVLFVIRFGDRPQKWNIAPFHSFIL